VPELGWTWIALSAVVVSTVVRGYADIVAYNLAEAAVLAPLTYMRLVLIGVGAYFVFGEVPDTATYIGAAIIVGSTLYIAQRQAALRRKAAKT
jgi:drug/metabolite transporter (DMT)-like permease